MRKYNRFVSFFLYGSFFCICLLVCYLLLSQVFAVQETENQRTPTATPMPELLLPRQNQFSILAVISDEDNSELQALYACYADFLLDTMTFVEIKTNTKMELSDAAFEILTVYRPELPKLLMVSELYRQFPAEQFALAAEELYVSLFAIRPKTCYVVPKALFEEFTSQKQGVVSMKMPSNLSGFLRNVHENGISNRTTEEEFLYYESYQDIKTVTMLPLPGTEESGGYRPNVEEAKSLMANLLKNNTSEKE